MTDLRNDVIVAAGGTGNIGTHVVRALLEAGATVAVPSRASEKGTDLKAFLGERLDEEKLARLAIFVGDLSDQEGGTRLVDEIVSTVGDPTGAVASLGRFVAAPSLLEAHPSDLRDALEGYTVAHFMAARALIPAVRRGGGTYVFINGPLAIGPWKDSGAGLVSVATAGQQMLFRALAQELEDANTSLVELVVHAFVRNRETQPGSPFPAEAVGRYVAHLLAERPSTHHGESIQLDSADVLHEAGVA